MQRWQPHLSVSALKKESLLSSKSLVSSVLILRSARMAWTNNIIWFKHPSTAEIIEAPCKFSKEAHIDAAVCTVGDQWSLPWEVDAYTTARIRQNKRLQRFHALVVGSSSCVSRHEHFNCLNRKQGLLRFACLEASWNTLRLPAGIRSTHSCHDVLQLSERISEWILRRMASKVQNIA